MHPAPSFRFSVAEGVKHAMTPHATQSHLDGSVSIRRYQGGWWTVREGWEDCDAERFCDVQNNWIEPWHQKSVKERVLRGVKDAI